VVLILYLSAIAPYMLGCVVDRGGDSTIVSFAVHPTCIGLVEPYTIWVVLYGPPWAHYLGGYQDRLLGGLLGLLGLCHTAPDGVGRKDYGGEVLGYEAIHILYYVENS
jgi:hypothetical protein